MGVDKIIVVCVSPNLFNFVNKFSRVEGEDTATFIINDIAPVK